MLSSTCLRCASLLLPQDALTAGLEAGISTVVFGEGQAALAQEWQQLGRFEAVTRTADGRLLGAAGEQVGPSTPDGMYNDFCLRNKPVPCRDSLACLRSQHRLVTHPSRLWSALRGYWRTAADASHIVYVPFQVGRVRLLGSPEDLRAAEREAVAAQGVVLMAATDWQVNLLLMMHD